MKKGGISGARLADNVMTYVLLAVVSDHLLLPLRVAHRRLLLQERRPALLLRLLPQGVLRPNLRRALHRRRKRLYPYKRWVLNTLYVASCTCVIGTLLVILTGYVMSRFRFKGRDTIRKTTLLLGMFPGFMGMTAVYIIMGQLGLLNSLESLIFYYSCTAPLGYLVQKGYFDSIPYTIHEAATIDGASQLQIFTKITLPLSKPMLVYTALTQFAWPWSDCLLPKLLLKEREMWTVAVGLYSMPDTQFARFAAGSVFIAVPIVILYFCLVKNIVNGLTAGAVKG